MVTNRPQMFRTLVRNLSSGSKSKSRCERQSSPLSSLSSMASAIFISWRVNGLSAATMMLRRVLACGSVALCNIFSYASSTSRGITSRSFFRRASIECNVSRIASSTKCNQRYVRCFMSLRCSIRSFWTLGANPRSLQIIVT